MCPQRAVTVLVVGRHTLTRRALRGLLASDPEIRVIGEAEDAAAAVAFVGTRQPDAVVIGPCHPGGNGATGFVARLLAMALDTRVVIVSDHPRATGGDAIRLPEDTSAGAFCAAVRDRGALAARRDSLSRRELQVLRLIALGHTNPEIARNLILSVRTIETHRARLQRKLGAMTRSELVRHALERGLVP
jgi:two-component system, NarL family, response regulator NreC